MPNALALLVDKNGTATPAAGLGPPLSQGCSSEAWNRVLKPSRGTLEARAAGGSNRPAVPPWAKPLAIVTHDAGPEPQPVDGFHGVQRSAAEITVHMLRLQECSLKAKWSNIYH